MIMHFEKKPVDAEGSCGASEVWDELRLPARAVSFSARYLNAVR